MSNFQQNRKGRKYAFKSQIRFIFLTKCRGYILTKKIVDRIEEIFQQSCIQMKTELLSFHAYDDYVDFVVNLHPTLSVSIFAGKLKEKSSRFLNKEFFSELENKTLQNHFWDSSYCAVSQGTNEEMVETFLKKDKKYVLTKI